MTVVEGRERLWTPGERDPDHQRVYHPSVRRAIPTILGVLLALAARWRKSMETAKGHR